MKRWLWVLWLILVALWSCTTAQSQPRQPAPSPAAEASILDAGDEPETAAATPLFLWETKTEVAEAYFLGSIHVANPEIYPLDPRIESAFERCDHLVLEADLDEAVLAEQMAVFVENALLPPGQNVFDSLDPELAARLRARLDELGLAPSRLAGFKLWFLTMTLSFAELERAGYSGDHGIDMHFRRRAEGKKPILALEDAEDQLALLQSMSEEAQEEDLELALSGEQVQQLGEMFRQWQRGDTEGLEGQLQDMRRDYPKMFDDLFLKRNQVMADGVTALLGKPGIYFVIVGAGHLVGGGSVIELLRQRGLNVTRL